MILDLQLFEEKKRDKFEWKFLYWNYDHKFKYLSVEIFGFW